MAAYCQSHAARSQYHADCAPNSRVLTSTQRPAYPDPGGECMTHRGEEHPLIGYVAVLLSMASPETGHQILTTKAHACEPYGDCR